ncbi:ORF3 [Ashy storm petrel gyrovirus]|uniref:ORF3 n=1 Tax=Ashy storm petrel gyrovirus TaxID=2249930 RepID=A0A2Z4N434_9VIRU|nr:ORF3 [Ashy storm petrel gyrovirus]AWX63611.1 ORF3 [Ashy storm petrel gyrovirus]
MDTIVMSSLGRWGRASRFALAAPCAPRAGRSRSARFASSALGPRGIRSITETLFSISKVKAFPRAQPGTAPINREPRQRRADPHVHPPVQ